MKRIYLTLCFMFVLALTASVGSFAQQGENPDVQTYKIDKYCWGNPIGRGLVWGREKKCDYQIIIDEKNRTIEIVGKKQNDKYRILDEHPTAYERYKLDISGPIYCALNDNSQHIEFYLRTHNGKVFEIIRFTGLPFWKYSVAE